MIIPSPPSSEDENRHLACQMLVEQPIQDLVKAAVAGGWKDIEVLSAIIAVADNLMLAASEITALEEMLAELKRRRDQSEACEWRRCNAVKASRRLAYSRRQTGHLEVGMDFA